MLVKLIERLTGRLYFVDPTCVRAVLPHEAGEGYCHVVTRIGGKSTTIPTSGDPDEVVELLLRTPTPSSSSE